MVAQSLVGSSGGETLDTTVLGDVDAARAVAEGLRQLQNAVDGLAGTYQSRQSLTQSWQGDASNAFASDAQLRYQDASSAADSGRDLATATDNWCDGITTAKTRMQSIRDTASQAGIPVNGNIVGPPLPPPPAPVMPDPYTLKVPPGQYNMADLNSGYDDALNAYKQQQTVWNELHQSYMDARGIHQATLDAMKKALGKAQAEMNGIIAIAGKAATAGLLLSGTVGETAQKLADVANRSRATAISALQGMKGSSSGPSAATYDQAWRVAESDAKNLEDYNRRLGNVPMQSWASKNLDFDRGIPLLNKLPVLGTLGSAAMTAVSVLQGAPPGKAITQTVSSTGAALAAGEIAAELVPDNPIGTAVKVLSGFGVGTGTSLVVGEVYDDIATNQAQQEYEKLHPGQPAGR